ncbi:MAG: hypothetical protein ABFD89_08180 [Bryobacteraceae bacterium]
MPIVNQAAETAARKRVERRCGKISDSVWKYAVDERMVSEFLQGESSLDWLVRKISRLTKLESGSPAPYIELSRRHRRTKRIPSRQEAISWYVAAQAREDGQVKWFRKAFLGGRVLRIEEVEPWILQQRNDYPYRHAVIVRLPAGVTPQPDVNGRYTLTPPLREISQFEVLVPVTFLEYHRAGSVWVQRVPAGPDGPLGALYKLSHRLAEMYGWQKAQASGFVLTDLIPEIPTCMVSSVCHELGGLVRIQIVVDPFYTPAEVAQTYKRIRSKMLVGKTKGLSEKHTQLALHALRQPELDQPCLQSWNQQYPNWAYRRMNRFRKEAQNAQRRLETMVRRFIIRPHKIIPS